MAVEAWGIFANVTGDSTIRDGAKVRMLFPNGGGESWMFRGLDRHGRKVDKYVRLARISNWRVGMIPPNEKADGYIFESRAEAQKNCPVNKEGESGPVGV